jgi:hypothetical protein
VADLRFDDRVAIITGVGHPDGTASGASMAVTAHMSGGS